MLLGAFLGALLAASCVQEGNRAAIREVDLLAGSASERTRAEVAEIDFLDSSYEQHLLIGWSPRAEQIRWSSGPSSALRFYLDRPRRLAVSAEGFALAYPEAPGQEVRVILNGAEIARFTFEPRAELQTARFELPEELVRRDNALAFHYSHPRRPVDVIEGSPDRRELAVAWKALRFEGVVTRRPPRLDAEGVTLGPGTAIEYALPPGPSGRFALERIEVLGRAPGSPEPKLRLELWRAPLEPAGGPEKRWLAPGPEPVEVAVEGEDGAFLRLSMPEEDGGGSDLELRLHRPRWQLDREDLDRGDSVGGEPGPGTDPESSAGGDPEAEARRPNVLIYLVDTLRADAVGAYGGIYGESGRPSASPRVDAFAEQATVFERAEASASWTRATVASIVTGLDADIHRTLRREHGLPEEAKTLPLLLREAGYRSLAVFTNSNASPMTGFGRGFESSEHLHEQSTPEIHQPAEKVTELALAWLDEVSRVGSAEEPFLLYLHVTDPHDPYLPPAIDREHLDLPEPTPGLGSGPMMRKLEKGEMDATPELAERLEELYRAEVRRTDRAFGTLVDGLVARGQWDSTLVILVSDHGEEFLDHGGWTHGRTLFSEMLSIPLIVKFPGGRGAGLRVPSVVRQIDVLPTVLDVVDLPVPAEVQGRSLAAALRGKLPPRPAHGYLYLGGGKARSVQVGDFKLILSERHRAMARGLELFDHSASRRDTPNLLAEGDAHALLRASYLEGLILAKAAFDPAPMEPGPAESTDEIEAQLRALVYL